MGLSCWVYSRILYYEHVHVYTPSLFHIYVEMVGAKLMFTRTQLEQHVIELPGVCLWYKLP